MSASGSAKNEAAQVVKAINVCLLEGRYDDIRQYFQDDVVLAMPGFERRIEGAEPIVNSYREFGEQAAIHRFEPEEPQIDVFGATAVSTTAFLIEYSYQGNRYRETGTDLLVLTNADIGWRVRYRTIVPKTSETL